MNKRELIKQWFSLLDRRHKNNVEIELSRKYDVSTLTVRSMWIYAGKVSDNLLDEILEALKDQCDKQDTERAYKKQSLMDAI